jgi:hypothetical protein
VPPSAQRLSHLTTSQARLGTHTLPAVSQCNPPLGICVLPHPFDWQVAPTLGITEAVAATRSVGVREAARALALRMVARRNRNRAAKDPGGRYLHAWRRTPDRIEGRGGIECL